MEKTRRKKADLHPANFTTCQFQSLRNLPALAQSEGVRQAAEDAEGIAEIAHSTAAETTMPGRCSDPKLIFGEPSPKTLADALLAACDGDQRKADLVRANADLSDEVDRLREVLNKALSDLNGEDQKIFPFLQAGEANSFVRQATHSHARQVLDHLPPGVRALWTTLLLKTLWGGYIEDKAKDLLAVTGVSQSTLYRHLKTLIDRGIIVRHPKGFLINPAIAQCCAQSEQFAKRQEFGAFYQREISRRKGSNPNGWGHISLTNDQPIERVLVGPMGEEVVAKYSDGGISAYVGAVSPNHAASIISHSSEKKSKKFPPVGKVKRSPRVPTA